MTITNTIDTIRERVDPSPTEQAALNTTAQELRELIKTELEELPVEADIIQTGSTARGTYVTGDRDIDMFIAFPESLPTPKLEQYGLKIGNAVLPDGREDYASHPYVKGTYNDFDVDLVPCYNVNSASNIKSAVDRTPFHTRFLEPKIDEQLASDVRVAKYFLKHADIYGSNDEIEGFSGYLTELLVLEAGGFREFLDMIAEWDSHVFVDPANRLDDPHSWAKDKPGHFFVVDPVDPNRNVADVVSQRQRARLQHHARKFLTNPSEFLPTDSDTDSESPQLEILDIIQEFNRRDTAAVAVTFDRPDLVDETLIPQLKRSLDGMTKLLHRHSFETFRSDWFVNADTAVLFAEVTPQEQPAIKIKRGPPVHFKEPSEAFLDKYSPDNNAMYITDDGVYAIEVEREYRTPSELLDGELIDSAAHGNAIEPILADGFCSARLDIRTSTAGDIVEQFKHDFNEFLNPTP